MKACQIILKMPVIRTDDPGGWYNAVSDQAKKNRLMKKALLEKEGHHANSRSKVVRLEKLFACPSAIMVK
jgi:hypothetical protein